MSEKVANAPPPGLFPPLIGGPGRLPLAELRRLESTSFQRFECNRRPDEDPSAAEDGAKNTTRSELLLLSAAAESLGRSGRN